MQLSQKQRETVFDEMLKLFPEPDRERARNATNEIADLFDGQDVNALGVLYRAAEKGRFDEFCSRLRDYYKNSGQYVPVGDRPIPAGENLKILRVLLQQEEEIRGGTRPAEDRDRFPIPVRRIMQHPDAIRMELFFADCYQEIRK